jgi:hypothetical protein
MTRYPVACDFVIHHASSLLASGHALLETEALPLGELLLLRGRFLSGQNYSGLRKEDIVDSLLIL